MKAVPTRVGMILKWGGREKLAVLSWQEITIALGTEADTGHAAKACAV